MNGRDAIAHMLRAKMIAVVGLSADPAKPSYFVSAYLQRAGKIILPVNPNLDGVLGVRSYASLRDLPCKPEVVNVFRPPDAIPAVVEEMIQLGLNAIWVQQGIQHDGAAARAESQGIRVVMDRCIMVDHRASLVS